MPLDLTQTLWGFALVGTMTPGPNNMMLLSSGATFGFSRTLPHMLGIGIGHPILVTAVGFGAIQVFDLVPGLRDVLTVVSLAYLLWLAFKILRSGQPGQGEARAKPLSFLQAAAFQWVNPKAWAMALGAVTIFSPEESIGGVLFVASAFLGAGVVSTASWTALGQQIRHVLREPLHLRLFNTTMAVLMVATVLPVLWL